MFTGYLLRWQLVRSFLISFAFPLFSRIFLREQQVLFKCRVIYEWNDTEAFVVRRNRSKHFPFASRLNTFDDLHTGAVGKPDNFGFYDHDHGFVSRKRQCLSLAKSCLDNIILILERRQLYLCHFNRETERVNHIFISIYEYDQACNLTLLLSSHKSRNVIVQPYWSCPTFPLTTHTIPSYVFKGPD